MPMALGTRSNGGWILYTPTPGFTNSDTFTYSISDGWGAPVTGTVTVNILIDNGPSSNLTISSLGNGSYAIGAMASPAAPIGFSLPTVHRAQTGKRWGLPRPTRMAAFSTLT